MTSCEGKAGLKRLDSKKNERPAAAPRNATAASAAVFPVSAIALAVALFAAAPQMARAAVGECGDDPMGPTTLTCSAASYPNGISYQTANWLTLNLDNPDMVMTGSQRVSVVSPVGATGATLAVNVVNIGSITSTGTAVSVVNTGIDGQAVATISGGKLIGTGSSATGVGARERK